MSIRNKTRHAATEAMKLGHGVTTQWISTLLNIDINHAGDIARHWEANSIYDCEVTMKGNTKLYKITNIRKQHSNNKLDLSECHNEIVQHLNNGLNLSETAKKIGVSPSTMSRYVSANKIPKKTASSPSKPVIREPGATSSIIDSFKRESNQLWALALGFNLEAKQ
ncbi:DNA-binding domain protein [Vibrio phage 1.052.A._10N.286.46.C3]|nr:DNA-binding domain protein [Vibrio phage 1.052.A._10N.286.46.C3]